MANSPSVVYDPAIFSRSNASSFSVGSFGANEEVVSLAVAMGGAGRAGEEVRQGCGDGWCVTGVPEATPVATDAGRVTNGEQTGEVDGLPRLHFE
mmetsp:Transcript_23778/g.72744  ORF Transcript_23778/g.72744 Transcript_23778/m.72744 type:complete len:95 (-) Transcript_23778:398-682(-)|eukprot:scaffold34633_cov25-Tisochrysis_lutea.AAC.3